MKRVKFPEGKRFAFTIFDDTDLATVENIKPVYNLLSDLGIYTTKSVWVYDTVNPENPFYGSKTLEYPEYSEFICWLAKNNFEIAFHNATMESVKRGKTYAAFEKFREIVGYYPRSFANHESNLENLYWGYERLDNFLLRVVIRLFGKSSRSYGHLSDSAYFWGDLAKQHISYVRNFVYPEINLLKINPTLPYHDPQRPCVNYWFSSSEGSDVNSFNKLLALRNQERLEEEGGVCIVYTHFAKGFVENGKVNSKTSELLNELSRRNGWFVPVSILLDYLRSERNNAIRPLNEKVKMEIMWLLSKVWLGTT